MSATSTSIFRGREQESYLSMAVALTGTTTLTAAQALNKTLKFTGTLTGAISIVFPVSADDAGLTWTIDNATGGGQTVTIKGAAFDGGAISTGIPLTQAKKMVVYWSGTEFIQLTADI